MSLQLFSHIYFFFMQLTPKSGIQCLLVSETLHIHNDANVVQ